MSHAPLRWRVALKARSASVRARVGSRLPPQENGVTSVSYVYEAEIGGKVASIGGRLLDGAARVVIGQFFAALARQAGGNNARQGVRQRRPHPLAAAVWRRAMKPAAFDYVRAESLDEALDVLRNECSDARVIAGGQSLMAMLNMRLAKPRVLIDIMRIEKLSRDRAGYPGKVTIRRRGSPSRNCWNGRRLRAN